MALGIVIGFMAMILFVALITIIVSNFCVRKVNTTKFRYIRRFEDDDISEQQAVNFLKLTNSIEQ